MAKKKLVVLVEYGGEDYVDRYVTVTVTQTVTRPIATRFVTSYVTQQLTVTPEQIAKSVVSGVVGSLETMGRAIGSVVTQIVTGLAKATEKQREIEEEKYRAMLRMGSYEAMQTLVTESRRALSQKITNLRERVAEAIAKLTLLAPMMKEDTYNFLRKYLEELYSSLPTAQSIAESASLDKIRMLNEYIGSIERVLDKIDEWFNEYYGAGAGTYVDTFAGVDVELYKPEEVEKKVEELKKLVLEGKLDQVKPSSFAQIRWGAEKVLDWATLQPIFDAIKGFARKLVEYAKIEPDPLKKALFEVAGHALNIGASAGQGATYTLLTIATGGMYLPVLVADMSTDIATSLSPPEREMLGEALEQLKNDPEALAMIAEEFAGMAVGGALATKAPSTNVLRSMESRLRLGLAKALEKLARKTNNAKLAELAKKIKLGAIKPKPVTMREVIGEEIPEAQRIEAYIDAEGNLRIVIAEKGRIKPVATIDKKTLSNVATLVEQRYGINGEAFVKHLESLIRTGKLDQETARALVEAIRRLGSDMLPKGIARELVDAIMKGRIAYVRSTLVQMGILKATEPSIGVSLLKGGELKLRLGGTGTEARIALSQEDLAEILRIAHEKNVSMARAFREWLKSKGISAKDFGKVLKFFESRLRELGIDVDRAVAQATRVPLDIVFSDGSELIIDPVSGRSIVLGVDMGKIARAVSVTANLSESEGNVVASRIIKEITVHKTPSGRIGNVEYQMIAEVRIPRGSSEFVRRIVNEILEAYRSRQLDELARVASKIADAVRNGRIPESVGEQLMWLVMKAPQIGQKTGVSIVPILTETDEGMNLVFAMVGSASSGAVQRALEMLREYARQANENVKQALSGSVKRGGVVIQPIAVKPRATPSKPSEGVSVPETPAKPSAEEIEKLMKAIEENRRKGEDYIKQLQALRHALREMFGDTVTADQITKSFPTLGEQLVKLLASTMGVVEVPIEVPVTVSRVEPVSQPITKEVTAWVATSATMDRNLRLVTVPIEQVVEIGSYEPERKEVVVDVDRRNPTMITVDRSLQLKTVYVRVPVTVGEQESATSVVSVEVPRTVPATLSYEGTVREVEVPVTSEVIVPVLLFNEVEIPLERGKPSPTPPSPPPPTPAPPPSFPSVPAVRYQSVPSGRPMPVRGTQMEEVVL